MSSKLMMGGSELVLVDPRRVRFTQISIANHFSEPHEHVSLDEALGQMNNKLLTPSDFPPIEVWKDEDGIMWSYDNRRLWLFRMAKGVKYVQAKPVYNGTKFRFRINMNRETLTEADFMPKIRGENNGNGSMFWAASSSNDSSNVGNQSLAEDTGAQSSLPGLLLSASAALAMGFASWKLYSRTKSEKDKSDNDK